MDDQSDTEEQTDAPATAETTGTDTVRTGESQRESDDPIEGDDRNDVVEATADGTSAETDDGSSETDAAESDPNADDRSAADETATRNADDPAEQEEGDATVSSDEDTAESKAEDTAESTDDGADTEQETDQPPVAEDLTPADIDVDRPDSFAFEYVDRDWLPPDIQYTPEFDDDWIYPSGTKAGGRRDDVPVQGLEVGLVGHADRLEATVEAILDGIGAYYEETGQYPRHRIIADANSFDRTSTGSVGLVAVFQARPDRYDGLVDHMQAMQSESGDAVANPNVESAQTLCAHLVAALNDHKPLGDIKVDDPMSELDGWEQGRRIADTLVVERYAPLAAGGLYDLTDDVDLDESDAESVAELPFRPTFLDIEDEPTLLRSRTDERSDRAGDERNIAETNDEDAEVEPDGPENKECDPDSGKDKKDGSGDDAGDRSTVDKSEADEAGD